MFKVIILCFMALISISGFTQEKSISNTDKEAVDKLYKKEKMFFSCAGLGSETDLLSDNGLSKSIVDKKNIVRKYYSSLSREYLSKIKKETKKDINNNNEVYTYAGKKDYELVREVTNTHVIAMKKDAVSFEKAISGMSDREVVAFVTYDAFMKNNCQKFVN